MSVIAKTLTKLSKIIAVNMKINNKVSLQNPLNMKSLTSYSPVDIAVVFTMLDQRLPKPLKAISAGLLISKKTTWNEKLNATIIKKKNTMTLAKENATSFSMKKWMAVDENAAASSKDNSKVVKSIVIEKNGLNHWSQFKKVVRQDENVDIIGKSSAMLDKDLKCNLIDSFTIKLQFRNFWVALKLK